MNQKLLSGFAACLLISTFGLAPSGYANQSQSADEQTGGKLSESGANQVASTTTPNNASRSQVAQPSSADSSSTVTELSATSEAKVSTPATPSQVATSAPTVDPTTSDSAAAQANGNEPPEVIKVGAYQSEASRADVTIATIQPHQLRGRQAATLYVRNIPVLTFLGAEATQNSQAEQPTDNNSSAEVKVASTQSDIGARVAAGLADKLAFPNNNVATRAIPAQSTQQDANDPVWRATTTAARLNQLYRDNANAGDIKISWDAERNQYLISANDTEIVAVDDKTVLPDTVDNAAGDMLQATNRIRRQMGNASPLSSIEGDPEGFGQVSVGPVSLRVSGYASWYGPGFDGNYSASGEVFNQEAITAAHPSLPFGTQVRVTNLDNGQSVVVRINDRGPYAHDRVIDLSTGAARVIGLIQAGVAPVSLEVLDRSRTASN